MLARCAIKAKQKEIEIIQRGRMYIWEGEPGSKNVSYKNITTAGTPNIEGYHKP